MLSNPRPLREVSTTRTLQVYKLLGIRYASHVIEASEKRPTPDASYTFAWLVWNPAESGTVFAGAGGAQKDSAAMSGSIAASPTSLRLFEIMRL